MGGLVSFALCGTAARMAQMTLRHGDDARADAELRLVRQSWTPTIRGRILDRHGRVLARPAPGFDLAVDFRVLNGRWARDQATAYAKRAHRALWGRLAPEQRAELVARYQPAFDAHLRSLLPRLAEACGTPVETLEAERASVIERVERMHAVFQRRNLSAAEAAALEQGRELSDAAAARIAEAEIREQTIPHALARDVPDAAALSIARLLEQTTEVRPGGASGEACRVKTYPGVTLVESGRRDYPLESVRVSVDRRTFPGPLRSDEPVEVEVRGLATHLLGWMRPVQAEDVKARTARLDLDPVFRADALSPSGADRGAYLPDDEVGATGIEASMEPVLRGLRGLSTLRLESGDTSELPARAGLDVRLTLDIALQARIHALMLPEAGLARVHEWHGRENESMSPGTPLHGAAVVLDVDSGDILAMVSTPSFTRDDLARDAASVFRDPVRTPWVNRALNKPYPPGSIVKAPILCEAALQGVLREGETIACTGHLYPAAPEAFRCWIYKSFGLTHQDTFQHALNPVEALMVSCNIFFYTLGRRLGPEGIAHAYRHWGVERPFDLGAGEEFAGKIGALGAPDGALDTQDATFMGMGQGPIAWTPLHAANAMATLARAGGILAPRLIADQPRPAAQGRLDYPAWSLRAALAGMEKSVSDRQGTGNHLTFADGRQEDIFTLPPGVRIWGKTGTAQAPSIVAPATEGAAPQVLRSGDHSWFVVMAGHDRPRFVIAVMMEYAGSGGRVSGPIVNQIIAALHAEGYL